MAYFTQGQVIDIGTALGLSGSLSAQAIDASGCDGQVDTVDLNASASAFARIAIARLPGAQRVHFHLPHK